jgi:FkbM family methyltransferase
MGMPSGDPGVSGTYFQETEYELAGRLLGALSDRVVVDVGAERGGFVDRVLQSGATRVFAIEPYPPHVEHLRRRFAGVDAVTVLDLAVTDRDGRAALHIARDRAGRPLDYHHSLLTFADTHDVQWKGEVAVGCRSLASLVRDGTIPARVGLVKIDTEGSDLTVLDGMDPLESDVIVVEYCQTPPAEAGASPYRLSDLVDRLRPAGFREFAYVKRHDEFEVVQIGTAETREGDWGNAFFLHDRVGDRLRPLVHAAAASVHDRLIDRALWFRAECAKRAEVIDELDRALKTARSPQ